MRTEAVTYLTTGRGMPDAVLSIVLWIYWLLCNVGHLFNANKDIEDPESTIAYVPPG